MSTSDPQRILPFAFAIGVACMVLLVFMSMRSAPVESDPCDCPLVRLDDAYCYSDLVFEGTPLKADTLYVQGDMRNSADSPIDRILVRFKVERVLKGTFTTMVMDIASADGGNCGFNFIPGQRYVVFATEDNGNMVTDRCTPSRAMDTVTRGFADSLAYVVSGKQWEGRVPVDKPCR